MLKRNNIDSKELDRHITGNYGQDQFDHMYERWFENFLNEAEKEVKEVMMLPLEEFWFEDKKYTAWIEKMYDKDLTPSLAGKLFARCFRIHCIRI